MNGSVLPDGSAAGVEDELEPALVELGLDVGAAAVGLEAELEATGVELEVELELELEDPLD